MSDGEPSPTTPPLTIEELARNYAELKAGQDELRAMVIYQAKLIDKLKRVLSRFGGIISEFKQSDTVVK